MTDNNSKKYDANFTAGGILHHEFLSLQEIILNENFAELMKIEEEQNSYMRVATKSARKRIISEIIRRYNNAPNNFWDYFINWSETEQKLGLFYLCLKTYPLILDIHLEVALKKFNIGSSLDPFDIQMRFDEIASVNVDVEKWSQKTLDKLNSQFRTALKETGLLNKKQLHKNTKCSEQFWNYFKEINESWFLKACFINSN
ncbi:DUF1819 family protein [Lutibacter sp. HS1-25]|uniref:BrxA family protein n=1 Tax=Lutibacter sp. HS1-25 TaxID=2485000 RepID=UPI001012D3A7|nr:BrxA family protein [Lutibacter sp. HS1-25]RXP53136.1 DUF1819 family protein [Lutibacter sp. HS1-25]